MNGTNNPDPDPQYTLGATADEAETHAQIVRSPLQGPGGIVKVLGQQYTLPRAQPDSEISRDTHGLPNG
jgi:hypothetical protein